MSPGPAKGAVEAAWRQGRASVLASVARRTGDLQLAEDAVQEAFLRATERWPADGVPDRPAAWLTTVAWRVAVDRQRRDRFPVTDVEEADRDPEQPPAPTVRDTLALALACCHPALSSEAQVALTLRHVVGMTDEQIAARFFTPAATMTKRLVRARSKIKVNRVSFQMPPDSAVAARLDEVRAVIYVVFTQGYAADRDPDGAHDLCDEAMWLSRQVLRCMPDDPETTALLALMLLHHSRRGARRDGSFELVPWTDQDRALWDTAALDEARQLLGAVPPDPERGPGPYGLQAAIALLHTSPPPGHEPAWDTISRLYAALHRHLPSAAVAVARAVALTRAGRPAEALDVLAPLLADDRHARYVALHAAHAEALAGTGNRSEAALAREQAVAIAATAPVKRRLVRTPDLDRPEPQDAARSHAPPPD